MDLLVFVDIYHRYNQVLSGNWLEYHLIKFDITLYFRFFFLSHNPNVVS